MVIILDYYPFLSLIGISDRLIFPPSVFATRKNRKMRLAKYFLRLAFTHFATGENKKCGLQKIFSKPHFYIRAKVSIQCTSFLKWEHRDTRIQRISVQIIRIETLRFRVSVF